MISWDCLGLTRKDFKFQIYDFIYFFCLGRFSPFILAFDRLQVGLSIH